MSLISVQNLTFAYDGSYSNVFENVSFQIDTDWKLGFVGRNGRGKTTFLNLLLGKYEYSGKISANVKFTYFPFKVHDEDRLVLEIMQELCPHSEDWEIMREFSYLQLSSDTVYSLFSTLSSGEKTKVLLASLFLNEGNFLLIDEPTNHLDSNARKTVSEYLKRKKGFILVSHDRTFIDGCVDHILSINRTDIEIQSGNFSSWLDNFEARQAAEEAQNELLKKEITRLSETAARTVAWADKVEASKNGKTSSGLKPDKGYVGHKSAKMMKRAKVTEARQQSAIEQKTELLKNSETSEDLKLFPQKFHSQKLLDCRNLTIDYSDKTVCKDVNFEILQGERIALSGKNGCGKSSILKLILGNNIPYTGAFKLASGLTISYVPQTSESVRGSISDYAAENNLDGVLFRAILNKMGFTKSDYDGDAATFSEGQKKKLLIAKSLCEKAHLYVWDEPLNFLDIYSRLQIQNLIKNFQPTMIFVEHDKAFRDEIATKIIEL